MRPFCRPGRGDWKYRRSRAGSPRVRGPPLSDNNTRTEVCERLQELFELVPEMRCGQLMAAVGELCTDLHGRGLWEATDAEFLEAVWQFRRNYESATARPGSTRTAP